MRSVAFCVLSLALVAAPTFSQTDVSGDWVVTWDSGIRVSGGKVEVTRRAESELRLTQVGDSVHGTWTNASLPDRRVWELEGTVKAGRLMLTGDQGEVESNGTRVRVHVTITGTLTNGTLAGTLYLRLNDREPEPRMWQAIRPPG